MSHYNPNIPPELLEEIATNKEMEHIIATNFLKKFLFIIGCMIFLTPVYGNIIEKLAYSSLSQDGKFSLEKSYEWCQIVAKPEYKEQYFNKLKKDIDPNNPKHIQALQDQERFYNGFYLEPCKKFWDLHDLQITTTDKYLFIILQEALHIWILFSVFTPIIFTSLKNKIKTLINKRRKQ